MARKPPFDSYSGIYSVSGNGHPALALQSYEMIILDEETTSANASDRRFIPSFSYLRGPTLREMDSSILLSWNGIVASG